MALYTRSGDDGTTSLLGGQRVSKADGRVDAYGDVDELNAWLGLVRSWNAEADIDEALARIQRDLFVVGAKLADPSEKVVSRTTKVDLGEADVVRLEHLIDRAEAEAPPLRRFVLAGGSPPAAAMHVARTVCRRAERRVAALRPAPDPVVLRYLNRLADLLFVFARTINHRSGVLEHEW